MLDQASQKLVRRDIKESSIERHFCCGFCSLISFSYLNNRSHTIACWDNFRPCDNFTVGHNKAAKYQSSLCTACVLLDEVSKITTTIEWRTLCACQLGIIYIEQWPGCDQCGHVTRYPPDTSLTLPLIRRPGLT